MRKKNMTITIIFFVKLALIAITIWHLPDILDYPHISKKKIIKEYEDNKVLFSNIVVNIERYKKDVEVHSNSREGDQYFIWIEADEENTLGSDRKITDNFFNKKLNILFAKLKYKGINKTENGLYFYRQTDIGFEQGIAFSLNGNKPNWPLITVLEPIEGNWYYYESK